jgi:glycosyltransferase involved in cell wall biosynthesis
MTIWIEVADLFAFAAEHARPTGIQRMAFAIAEALHSGGEVRFARYQPKGRPFLEQDWPTIAALFAPAAQEGPPARIRTGARPAPPRRGPLRAWLADVLPPEFRLALGRAARAQIASWRALAQAVAALLRALTRRAPALPRTPAGFAPGDVLLCLGSPWAFPDYPARLAELRARGVRVASFVHDVIPLRRPEWCDTYVIQDYRDWFTGALTLSDHIFVAADATAADITRAAADLGVSLPAPPCKIPIGTGLGGPPPPPPAAPARPDLPAPGTYVLSVGTIEPRKNHALLIRIWQHLLETRPPASVPPLILAGRPGWMTGDLLQQLENAGHLDSHVIRVEGASDRELAALYRGAQFTLYPSLYEGWGLPVVESLAFGTPCLAANTTSLPEAGGPLARYFDPHNLHAAIAAVTTLLDNPADLAAWRATIAAQFRPIPWSDTARAILSALEARA